MMNNQMDATAASPKLIKISILTHDSISKYKETLYIKIQGNTIWFPRALNLVLTVWLTLWDFKLVLLLRDANMESLQ